MRVLWKKKICERGAIFPPALAFVKPAAQISERDGGLLPENTLLVIRGITGLFFFFIVSIDKVREAAFRKEVQPRLLLSPLSSLHAAEVQLRVLFFFNLIYLFIYFYQL